MENTDNPGIKCSGIKCRGKLKSDLTNIYELVSTLGNIISKMSNICSVQNHEYNN